MRTNHKIFLTTFFFTVIVFNTHPQISYCVGECQRNSAVLAQCLIDVFDKDSVSAMLEKNNFNVYIVCDIDSMGYIKKFHLISSKYLSDNQLQRLKSYLILKPYFCVCLDIDTYFGGSCIEKIENHRKSLKEQGIEETINASMPKYFMSQFQYESEEIQQLSKYEYLLLQIERNINKCPCNIE